MFVPLKTCNLGDQSFSVHLRELDAFILPTIVKIDILLQLVNMECEDLQLGHEVLFYFDQLVIENLLHPWIQIVSGIK